TSISATPPRSKRGRGRSPTRRSADCGLSGRGRLRCAGRPARMTGSAASRPPWTDPTSASLANRSPMMRSLFRTALLGAAALHAPVLSQETAEEATSPTSAPAVAVAEEAKAPPTVALVRPSGQYADLAEQGADLTALLLGGGGGKVHAFYDFVAKIAALREAP